VFGLAGFGFASFEQEKCYQAGRKGEASRRDEAPVETVD
jgi:hypothetical protein